MILLSAGLISRDVVTGPAFSVVPTEMRKYTMLLPEPVTIIKFNNGTTTVPMVPFADASEKSQRIAKLALRHWHCERKALAGTVLTLASKKDVAEQSLLALQRLTDQISACAGSGDSVIDKMLHAYGLVQLRTFVPCESCPVVPPAATFLRDLQHVKLYQDSDKLYKVYDKQSTFKKALRWYKTQRRFALPLIRAQICFLSTRNQFVLVLKKPDGVGQATAALKRLTPYFVTLDGTTHPELDDVFSRRTAESPPVVVQ